MSGPQHAVVDGHNVVRLESDHVRIGVDVDRGAHIFELVDRSSGINLMYTDPRGLARHMVGGWFELFPNAGPGCVVGGVEMPNHGDVRDLPWKIRDMSSDSVGLAVSSTLLPLQLEKTVRLRGATVLVTERVSNTGAVPVEFLWGHHVTFGSPFVDGAVVGTSDTVFFADRRYPTAAGRVAPDRPGPLTDLRCGRGPGGPQSVSAGTGDGDVVRGQAVHRTGYGGQRRVGRRRGD